MFFPTLLFAGIAALIGWNAWTYYHATGTVADRLSAMWKGSMTIFVGVVAFVASLLTAGLNGLATLTGDPLFTQWSDAIKPMIPPKWQPFIPLAGITAMLLARLRTAGK